MDSSTLNLTAPLTITPEDGIYRLSVIASGGDISITGNVAFTPKSTGVPMPSVPIVLHDTQGVTMEANPNRGINLTINPLTAVAKTIIFYN